MQYHRESLRVLREESPFRRFSQSRRPVSPADLVATLYQQLGIDPHLQVKDRLGRPFPIAHGGEPVGGVVG